MINIPTRGLIKKRLFFPLKTIPKCDQRRLLSPIANCMVSIIIIMILSVIIHWLILLFWSSHKTDFEVKTFCARYLAEFKDNVYHFSGVPYAVAPNLMKLSIKDILGRKLSVDSLRWKKAVELDSIESCFASHSNKCNFNNSIWKCKENRLKKRCVDFNKDLTKKIDNGTTEVSMESNEDCLYLNIHIPQKRPQKATVVVFIGGTNYGTEVSEKLGKNFPFHPSGEFVNEINSIFITVQYRMGLFGTFMDKNLKLKNFAILDLLVAFNWIKNNIEKFGGDKTKVTLLAHGTGATLGLSVLLNSTKYFQSVWLASGAVHIPKDDQFFEGLFQKLLIHVEPRCISASFYYRFCRKMYDKLLLVKSEDVVKIVSNLYQIENSFSSLLDAEAIIHRDQTQKPFLAIDLQTIVASPSSLIYQNTIPTIPMVFTTMLCELDGFPGSREWSRKSFEQIQKELLTMLIFLFKISKIQDETNAANNIWQDVLKYVKKKKMTMGEMAIQLLSLIRISCPYYWIGNKIRLLQKFPVYNIIHTEIPSQPLKAMLFPERIKRYPFYGLDILMLFKRHRIYMNKLSEDSKHYQNELIKVFKEFLEYKTIRGIDNEEKTFFELDHSGLRPLENKIYSSLCDKIDYETLIGFLNKIN